MNPLKMAPVACFIAAPCWAQESQPEIRQFDIPTIEKLGHDIYLQDQAAWHATDALMALHPASELSQEKVRGWIVEAKPDGQLVRFIRDGANGLEAAYDIADATGMPRVSVSQDRNLTDEEREMFAARSAIAHSVTRPCSDHYNTVVLHDPQGGGWLAWTLAASNTPKTWFIGSNYRFTVSKDGGSILRTDALSRSCLTMAQPPDTPGKTVAAFGSTQLVSNIPVETAIFVNLESGLPMFVGTPEGTLWWIENGTMHKAGTVPVRPDTSPK